MRVSTWRQKKTAKDLLHLVTKSTTTHMKERAGSWGLPFNHPLSLSRTFMQCSLFFRDAKNMHPPILRCICIDPPLLFTMSVNEAVSTLSLYVHITLQTLLVDFIPHTEPVSISACDIKSRWAACLCSVLLFFALSLYRLGLCSKLATPSTHTLLICTIHQKKYILPPDLGAHARAHSSLSHIIIVNSPN